MPEVVLDYASLFQGYFCSKCEMPIFKLPMYQRKIDLFKYKTSSEKELKKGYECFCYTCNSFNDKAFTPKLISRKM